MAEEKITAEVEAKDRSKTDRFKEHVQQIIYQTLGAKVSKEKAWSLFKNVIHGTTEFVLNEEDKTLALSGVGTYKILETKPRGSKAGLDKDGNPVEGAKVWDNVPRFRFYPSTVTTNMIEQVFGLADHGVEVKHYGIFNKDAVVEVEEKKPAKAKKEKPVKAEKAEKAETPDEPDDLI